MAPHPRTRSEARKCVETDTLVECGPRAFLLIKPANPLLRRELVRMAKKKVVLLGCGGFVGSHLTDRLLARGDYVIEGWDTQTAKIERHLRNPNLRVHQTYVDDQTTFPELEPYVADADAVISLAAVCNPAQYVANPVFTIHSNFIHAYKLVDLCSKHRKWLVHTSTCEVYGRTISSYLPGNDYSDPRLYRQVEDETPLVMGPTVNQRWSYAAAKALFERYLLAHGQEYGLPYSIIRPYNWFGPKMDFIPGRDGDGIPRVLACFMTALLDRQPMLLVDGGQAYRTITYIEDAIDALEAVLESPSRSKSQIFNVGNAEGEIKIADLAELMRKTYAEITGDASYLEHPIEEIPGEKFYGEGYEDCDRRVPSLDKAKRLLGWEAKTSLRDTLRITMQYYYETYGERSGQGS
jgi:UDP-apiose/xylose synthase